MVLLFISAKDIVKLENALEFEVYAKAKEPDFSFSVTTL
jgi:hypothetical protein